MAVMTNLHPLHRLNLISIIALHPITIEGITLEAVDAVALQGASVPLAGVFKHASSNT